MSPGNKKKLNFGLLGGLRIEGQKRMRVTLKTICNQNKLICLCDANRIELIVELVVIIQLVNSSGKRLQ